MQLKAQNMVKNCYLLMDDQMRYFSCSVHTKQLLLLFYCLHGSIQSTLDYYGLNDLFPVLRKLAMYTDIFYMIDQSEHVALCEHKEIPLHSWV